LGKFWRALECKKVGIFFGNLEYIYYGRLVHFMAIWQFSGDLVHISPRFGILCWEKSGNPGWTPSSVCQSVR
jgi:hypothetical protein